MYCQVIIDIIHENVASPFTYRIPEGMKLEPGQRVAVPFGRREKEGIVLGLTAESGIDEKKIREVIRPLEDYAAVPAELMELAEQMAKEAHCPLAETLRLMLPAQMRGGRVHIRTERTARLSVNPEEAEAAAAREKRSPKRCALLRILADGKAHSVKELSEEVKDPNGALRKLAEDGLICITEEESLRTPGGVFTQPEDPGFRLTPGQKDALEEILPCLSGKAEDFCFTE